MVIGAVLHHTRAVRIGSYCSGNGRCYRLVVYNKLHLRRSTVRYYVGCLYEVATGTQRSAFCSSIARTRYCCRTIVLQPGKLTPATPDDTPSTSTSVTNAEPFTGAQSVWSVSVRFAAGIEINIRVIVNMDGRICFTLIRAVDYFNGIEAAVDFLRCVRAQD